MANSLSELKKNRKNRFDTLKNKVENMNSGGGGNQDDRFWRPEVDKSGNGFAIIRFLDAPQGEEDPYVRIFSHAFQGPNGWYIENSLTTLGKNDPISDYNRRLWNSGIESDKDIVRAQKRKLNYIANIYVVKDPTHPENEGQVFLYRFGKRIFDKIHEKMEPEFEDETPVNVFDFWEGANFRLKMMNKDGYRNYDRSVFDEPSAIFESDEEISKLWEREHSLKQFLADENFKNYDELKDRLNHVMGFDTGAAELHRPGDVVENTPRNYETAESKLQEKFDETKPEKSQEVPEALQKDDSAESEDEDDYFDDLASKL